MLHRPILLALLLVGAAASSCSSLTAIIYQGRLEYGPRESNGKQKGLWTYWYDVDHTQIRARGHFESDVAVGPWEFFHPNGTKRWEVSFRDEAYDGPSTAWWPNGAMRSQGAFDGGLETGTWSFWNEDGVKTAEGSFAAGARDGLWRHYAANGALQSEIVFERGSARPTQVAGGAPSSNAANPTPGPTAAEPATTAPNSAPPSNPLPVAATPPTPVIGVVPAPFSIVQGGKAHADADIPNVKGYSIEDLTYIYETGKPPAPKAGGSAKLGGYGPEDVRNPAHIPKNLEEKAREFEGKPLPWTRLVQGDGTEFDLASYRGRSNVLVVVLRGLKGRVCEYCTAQTQALQRSAEEFRRLNCEIVIVYPGPSERLEQFVSAAREYYQVHYGSEQPASTCKLTCDDGFQLVKNLRLEGDLAQPAVFLLDRSSVVQFAWISKDKQDRPSCARLLDELRKLP